MRGAIKSCLWVAVAQLIVACAPSVEPSRQIDPTIISLSQIRLPASKLPVLPGADELADGQSVANVQRSLIALGYNLGQVDGVRGTATRRAIVTFQKDQGLEVDGRLTLALLKRLRSSVAKEAASRLVEVHPGDVLVFDNGSVEIASAEYSILWDEDKPHSLVAIRPPVSDWPPAARAGLDWAITHALDLSGSAPVLWSSTGVSEHFDIYVLAALTPREAEIVGHNLTSCRHFEMRTDDPATRYPAIACEDRNGFWNIPHSQIRFLRPATALRPEVSSSLDGH